MTMDVAPEEKLDSEECTKRIRELLCINNNSTCADCSADDPQWCSTSLGTVLCTPCSGIHRNLGVHISRVKSLFLDNWTVGELKTFSDLGGNKNAYEMFCASLPSFIISPTGDDSTLLKEQWIRAKYERKIYSLGTKKVVESSEIPTKKGYLTKKGKLVKNWKKRWFVLHGTVLSYYKKKSDSIPAGTILLTEAETLVDAVDDNNEKQKFCIRIPTPGRVFLVNAETGSEMYDWIQMCRVCQTSLIRARSDEPSMSFDDIDLDAAYARIFEGVPKTKIKVGGKTEENVFSGITLVDFLVCGAAVSRKNAVFIASQLYDRAYFVSVAQNKEFRDAYVFYQLNKKL